MTSVRRMPFESYTAQMSQEYANSNSNLRQSGHQTSHKMNNFNDTNSFKTSPKLTPFSIAQIEVDDHEDPEEKMHSPRTPYGSVPDHNHTRTFHFNTASKACNNTSLYSSNMTLSTMQRTISASSFESVQSYSANSTSDILNYAPSLSATNSLTRSDLKTAYSTSTSPGASPCATPKAYKLRVESTIEEKVEEEEEGTEEEHESAFGHQQKRVQQIDEALHEALTALKSKKQKQNGFVLYKHGLATYSASNSGANTTGTATPNSIGALSRASSYGSVAGGSECSFDDNAIEDDFVSSGASTPILMEVNINQNKVMDYSEDEMETPVPTSADNDCSPFDFKESTLFDRNTFALAQISEDVEHESILITPNTNRTELESKESEESGEQRHFEHDMIDDMDSDEDEEEELPVPQEPTFEDEIILKGSRFQSSRVLFLDVDGVLLSTKEQAHLGRGENIKFNDEVTSLMCKLYRETECDIVISSTWQFHTVSHLPYLISYLEACGWRRNKIHTLLDLLPSHANDGINYGREWYEESPYCRCRARGIQKIVSLYGNYITRWCCLDDLPLHSQKPVCIPKKDDISRIVDEVSDAYFKVFTWRAQDREALIPDVKYCVKYALTSLPNCIFGVQSYRFGYEYNQTMIYYQSDAIAKLCKLTYEIKDNGTYQMILQNMMAVLNKYISNNLSYQGDPYITPYLIQTNQETGITAQNIENTITLLIYDDYQRGIISGSAQTTAGNHRLNDANTV